MTPVSVLGVLPVCWLDYPNPTQSQTAPLLDFRGVVLGVLGLSRPRACVCALVVFKVSGI